MSQATVYRVGQTAHLNGDTGQIVEVWPDGTWVLVQWHPGTSDIAGRTLWAPVEILQTDEPEPPAEPEPTPETALQLALGL